MAGPDGVFVNNGAAIDEMYGDKLTPGERQRLLAEAAGTPFDPFERLFASFDGGTAFAYTEDTAADYRAMLKREGKASALEQILTLPIRGADWKITPEEDDSGQAELVQACLGDKLDLIIDQMTSAVTYRRAFFENSWVVDPGGSGALIYSEVAMRPATGCEAGFNPRNGRYKGFRQRIVPVAGVWPKPQGDGNAGAGWVEIKANRAFVYVHGVHRDPINGISDLETAHWYYQTKQKVLFLWFQFLEQQALPKMIVYGADEVQARERAEKVRGLKSSGVLGMERPGEPNEKAFELIESSGKGADQFKDAINYLDTMMSASVLAGFTDLTAAQGGSAGSYALSADQSEFFLKSRQAVADEMANAIRRDLFGPLIAFNFGVDSPVPKIEIGPISKKQGENALEMLKAVVTAVNLNVPHDFVDQLCIICSAMMGMDADAVMRAIEEDTVRRDEQQKLQDQANKAQAEQMVAEAKQAQQAPPAGMSDPAAPPPVSKTQTVSSGSAVAGASLSNPIVSAVDTVYDLVTGARHA